MKVFFQIPFQALWGSFLSFLAFNSSQVSTRWAPTIVREIKLINTHRIHVWYFTYIWLICMVNVGKYTIYGSYAWDINGLLNSLNGVIIGLITRADHVSAGVFQYSEASLSCKGCIQSNKLNPAVFVTRRYPCIICILQICILVDLFG